jgi:hypothetical protein
MNDEIYKREKDKIWQDYKERWNYETDISCHEECDDGGELFNRLMGKIGEINEISIAEDLEENKHYKSFNNKIFIVAGILFCACMVWKFV